MVILKVLGGFASQLGKFVFAHSIAMEKQTELVLDISEYLDGYFRPFMLQYLNLPDCRLVNGIEEDSDIVKIKNGQQLIDVFEQENFPDIYLYLEEVDYAAFFEKYPHCRIHAGSELLKTLKIKEGSSRLKDFETLIQGTESVAVHVRRGDFVALGWEDNTPRYQEAIGHLMSTHSNAKIIFFSNDIKWVKETYGEHPQFYFVENGRGCLGDVEDFFCLSMCKWKILSSMSGYSLYANYLGLTSYQTMPAIVLNHPANNDQGVVTLSSEQREKGYEYYLEESKRCKFSSVHQEVARSSTTNKDSVVIITREHLDGWKWKGLYRVAKILAEQGLRVLYMSHYPESFKNMEKDVIVPGKDMDGNDMGFDMVLVSQELRDVDSIICQWNERADTDFVIFTDAYVDTKHKVFRIKRNKGLEELKYNLKFLLTHLNKFIKIIASSGTVSLDETIDLSSVSRLSDIQTEEDLRIVVEENATRTAKEIMRYSCMKG